MDLIELVVDQDSGDTTVRALGGHPLDRAVVEVELRRRPTRVDPVHGRLAGAIHRQYLPRTTVEDGRVGVLKPHRFGDVRPDNREAVDVDIRVLGGTVPLPGDLHTDRVNGLTVHPTPFPRETELFAGAVQVEGSLVFVINPDPGDTAVGPTRGDPLDVGTGEGKLDL